MRKFASIFLLAFLSNYLWEEVHSLLYLSYKGGEITQFILFHATLGDAVMLTVLALPFVYWKFFAERKWLIIPIGIILAISIELAALSAGRWEYNALMPIIPFVHVGLTPTLQLGLLGYLIYAIVLRPSKQ